MKTLGKSNRIGAPEKALLHEAKQVIRGFAPRAAILLHGSVARGTHTAGFDFDLLVLTPQALPAAVERQIQDALYEVELEWNAVISCMFFTRAQWQRELLLQAMPFRQAVMRDAVRV
jgi:predicted nucleotidyltransferase